MHECDKRGCKPMPYGASQISHCPVCHETFKSNRIGDKHRVGEFEPNTRRCLTLEEMTAKGWERDDLGRWGGGEASRAHLARTLQKAQTVNPEGREEG